jgi:acetoin:2,6-dichlorophenolindophenol oxidoreductase subunit alpha
VISIALHDLELMLFIRRFEENLLQLYAEGKIAGTTHTCIGQEYIPVAMAPLLRDDFIISNHRGHGHYLSHCDDAEGLLAELMGRQGGASGGFGGSQHLRRDSYISTGIQGEGLAVGTGVALHFRNSGLPRIVAVYVGDGTWGEGAVYEALNMAQLWRLPVLVLVEHNGIAQSTETAHQMAGTIAGRAAGFGITCKEIHSTDITAVRAEMAADVARVRAEHRPHVAVFHTLRLGPHSKGDDSRAPAAIARLAERDWLRAAASNDPATFDRLDAKARDRVAQVTATVSARPLAGDAPW